MPATTIGICPPAPMMVICPAPASFTSLEWITATGLELMVVRVLALLPGTQAPLPTTIGLRLSTIAAPLGTCPSPMATSTTSIRTPATMCVVSARRKIYQFHSSSSYKSTYQYDITFFIRNSSVLLNFGKR